MNGDKQQIDASFGFRFSLPRPMAMREAAKLRRIELACRLMQTACDGTVLMDESHLADIADEFDRLASIVRRARASAGGQR